MRHQLITEIVIDAEPAAVWAVLTDLPAYPDWNPFIVEAAGNLIVGARLRNRIQPPDGKAMVFRPVITEFQSDRVLEWLGRLGIPGIFDGLHRFELVPSGEATRLIHSERFRGVLVGMMRRSIDSEIRAGFEAMNLALKARVETGGQ